MAKSIIQRADSISRECDASKGMECLAVNWPGTSGPDDGHATIFFVFGARKPRRSAIYLLRYSGRRISLQHGARNVGRGRWTDVDMQRILTTGSRTHAGETAPPQGLYLMRVDY